MSFFPSNFRFATKHLRSSLYSSARHAPMSCTPIYTSIACKKTLQRVFKSADRTCTLVRAYIGQFFFLSTKPLFFFGFSLIVAHIATLFDSIRASTRRACFVDGRHSLVPQLLSPKHQNRSFSLTPLQVTGGKHLLASRHAACIAKVPRASANMSDYTAPLGGLSDTLNAAF